MKNSDISPIILRPWPIPLVTNNDGRVQLAESNFPAYRTKIYGGQHIQIHQKFGWNFRFFKIFSLGHKILWLGNPPSLWISYLITGNLWKNYYFPLGYLLLPHFHLPSQQFWCLQFGHWLAWGTHARQLSFLVGPSPGPRPYDRVGCHCFGG